MFCSWRFWTAGPEDWEVCRASACACWTSSCGCCVVRRWKDPDLEEELYQVDDTAAQPLHADGPGAQRSPSGAWEKHVDRLIRCWGSEWVWGSVSLKIGTFLFLRCKTSWIFSRKLFWKIVLKKHFWKNYFEIFFSLKHFFWNFFFKKFFFWKIFFLKIFFCPSSAHVQIISIWLL